MSMPGNKNRILSAAVCLILFAFFYQASAQHHEGEYAPDFSVAELSAPPLMPGIGTSEMKISTKSEAAELYRRFLKVWENADTDLPAVLEARAWLKNNA